MHVAFPDVASSSHTVPPSEPEANYSQIMEALAAIQGGMSHHAAVHLLLTARNAVHQQAGGAYPFVPSRVPSSPSSGQQ
jgi:hypothetical protein